MALSPESSFSASVPPTDADSQVASRPESTPPTTISDAASMHSNTPKHDVITVDVAPSPSPAVNEQETATPAAASNEPTPRRGQRSRGGNPPTYNLAKLSGTAGHGKRASKGDIISFRRRRRTLGAATRDEAAKLAEDDAPTPTVSAKADERSRDALNLCNWSPEPSPSPTTRPQVRESPRHRHPTARLSETLTDSASGPTAKSTAASSKANDKPATKNNSKANGKNSGTRAVALKASSQPAPKMSRELRRLQDTKEFEHRDEQPIIYTVWAKGKYVNPNEPVEDKTPRAKTKVKPTLEEQESTKSPEPIVNAGKRRVKKYLDKGLYAGQETPKDVTKGLTANEKRALSQLPQLKSTGRVNRMMPEPMFNGLRTLISGRDFKLPFHVCNPLPPGQPKPDEWKKMTKNRFIGESREIWRKSPHFHDYQSKCVCTPEDGCAESCQNRIMLYECDETNCNVGPEYCTNRAFANLTARRNKGGKYRVGVEVVKTSDRGHGVRSNRCFQPHQIIMEYAGEIITEEECERRMNEVYKDNECYYLMSFDQNMIIDATTGSIARFVNHSCNPNCRMIKWIVSGQPRMALFAGDKPIMTGDELTYDYNFDPFSAKNVQKCLCGEANCRGVLGPKPREAKPAIKTLLNNTVKAGKRKISELLGNDQGDDDQPKAKKAKPITSTKGALASVGMKVSKGAATALKKGMSTLSAGAKKVALSAQSTAKQRATTTTSAVLKKKTTTRVIKAYGKESSKKLTTKAATAARGKGTKALKTIPQAKAKASTKKEDQKAMAKKTSIKKTVTKKVSATMTSEKGRVLSTAAGVTKKTSPKKKQVASWVAINASPRKALDLERGSEITVAE